MALLGCAYASPFLQYTPEVVAERARFQQLYNAAAAAAAAAPDPVDSATQFHQAPAVSHHQPAHSAVFTTKWTGPVAATVPAGLPGAGSQVQDTADVAAARDAFLSAFRAQVAATTGQKATPNPWAQSVQNPAPTFSQQPSSQKWVGPLATDTPAGINGQVTPVGDTADVTAARNAFFAAYNKALAATQPAQQAPVHHAPQTRFATNAIQQPVAKWTGPVAATVPAGLPGSVSQVAPTADVAAATNAFYQAYSAAVAATTGRRF